MRGGRKGRGIKRGGGGRESDGGVSADLCVVVFGGMRGCDHFLYIEIGSNLK